MSTRESEREYDRIAGSRIAKMNGGIALHVALAKSPSITLRNKLKRMGLKGEHITDLVKMIDDLGYQKTLSEQPIGVRFATVKQAQRKPRIWSPRKGV